MKNSDKQMQWIYAYVANDMQNSMLTILYNASIPRIISYKFMSISSHINANFPFPLIFVTECWKGKKHVKLVFLFHSKIYPTNKLLQQSSYS